MTLTATEGIVNAHSGIKGGRRLRASDIARGVASFTFDQKAGKIYLMSDREAIASDWQITGSDLRKAVREAKPRYERA